MHLSMLFSLRRVARFLEWRGSFKRLTLINDALSAPYLAAYLNKRCTRTGKQRVCRFQEYSGSYRYPVDLMDASCGPALAEPCGYVVDRIPAAHTLSTLSDLASTKFIGSIKGCIDMNNGTVQIGQVLLEDFACPIGTSRSMGDINYSLTAPGCCVV